MRDLSTFYEPILNQKEQKRWVQLYVKKIFKERLPDNIEKDPAADMMIWFDLTPQALEVRVRDILKGEDVAEVEQPVRSSKPAHLRRVVADAAKKTTRRIMSSYDPAFGDTYYLRVKVPPITGFSIGQTTKRKKRWQTLPLARDGLYSNFPGRIGEELVNINSSDVILGRAYPDWRIVAEAGTASTISYRMEPYRLALELGGGIALPEASLTGWSYGALDLLLNPNISLRGGVNYFVLPVETQVVPIVNEPAAVREWRTERIVPFVGLGYQVRDLTLGVRFGLTLDGFLAPNYIRGNTWLSAEKVPWLRLMFSYQTLSTEVEERTFARLRPAADLSTKNQQFNFISTGLGLHFPLK